MSEQKFKPYIPAEKITPEFTITSIVADVILDVVFGAANAYLGLRVGMTVSASIPAAVISMGVIRVLLKRNSILESNLVQTVGSAVKPLPVQAFTQSWYYFSGQKKDMLPNHRYSPWHLFHCAVLSLASCS